ncbi:MAG: type II toxin-antitoxin system PemK/MazF family toxin [Candidatus Rokubacteria bacterium]|nr:type II toxin-antitoxin system PemK/MazF family toxin [Candidatus Rokubacteria bacterium]MBI3457555.1 type II toxin-antitoxin system PemK/MazF family toxin [Candidatus Rokubacteria bacterium]
MARVLRREVYWADLNPARGRKQAGLRPVLVISHEPGVVRAARAIER